MTTSGKPTTAASIKAHIAAVKEQRRLKLRAASAKAEERTYNDPRAWEPWDGGEM